MEKENKIFGSNSFVLIVMGEWTVQQRRAYSLEADGYSGLMGGIRMNRRKKSIQVQESRQSRRISERVDRQQIYKGFRG